MRKFAGLGLAMLAVCVAGVALAAQSSGTVATVSHGGIRSSVTRVFGWRTAINADLFPNLTVLEMAEKANQLNVQAIEVSSSQTVSQDIAKKLDANLPPSDLEMFKKRFGELREDGAGMRLVAYNVSQVGADENSWRKVFQFAKELGVDTIISDPGPPLLGKLEALANEFSINVAVKNGSRSQTPAYWAPTEMMRVLLGKGKRIGVCADLGEWMKAGIKPVDALPVVNSRLMVVHLQDRTGLGIEGKPVPFGSGTADAKEFFDELGRGQRPDTLVSKSKCVDCARLLDGSKPVILAIEGTGAADPLSDFSRSLVGYEFVARLAMGKFMGEVSRATPITGLDAVPFDDRQKIQAALPKKAPATPKQKRKLLVVDLSDLFYHFTVPHGNFAIGLMGKQTGAYEAVFSNDLDSLKYPQITEYDAVFLNNAVGALFSDPEVMAGLMRFVREGGGLAGLHGSSYSSMEIPEFGELIGAQDGPHRIETATLRIDDPNSPLTKPLVDSPLTQEFGGKGFTYVDEYYHFLPTGPYSREQLHVLLSIDVDKSPKSDLLKVRSDNDYGLSWISNYGKGRVFNLAMGHTATLFQTPALAEYVLAGIQFVLGDLAADATASAKLPAQRSQK
jgi:type 1 glutamine amidotransferase/sugar phosphate isomerase/epimerase